MTRENPRSQSPQPIAESEGTKVHPGDQAPPGSPQTGENVCPRCNGTGRLGQGTACENCGGTGKVVEIVGDA